MALRCWFCSRSDEWEQMFGCAHCLHCGEYTKYTTGPFVATGPYSAPSRRPATQLQIDQGHA